MTTTSQPNTTVGNESAYATKYHVAMELLFHPGDWFRLPKLLHKIVVVAVKPKGKHKESVRGTHRLGDAAYTLAAVINQSAAKKATTTNDGWVCFSANVAEDETGFAPDRIDTHVEFLLSSGLIEKRREKRPHSRRELRINWSMLADKLQEAQRAQESHIRGIPESDGKTAKTQEKTRESHIRGIPESDFTLGEFPKVTLGEFPNVIDKEEIITKKKKIPRGDCCAVPGSSAGQNGCTEKRFSTNGHSSVSTNGVVPPAPKGDRRADTPRNTHASAPNRVNARTSKSTHTPAPNPVNGRLADPLGIGDAARVHKNTDDKRPAPTPKPVPSVYYTLADLLHEARVRKEKLTSKGFDPTTRATWARQFRNLVRDRFDGAVDRVHSALIYYSEHDIVWSGAPFVASNPNHFVNALPNVERERAQARFRRKQRLNGKMPDEWVC